MPETANAPTVFDLPPPATMSVGSMRFLKAWVFGFGRFAGWLIIPLVPIFIFSAAAIFELMGDACTSGRFWSDRTYDVACIRRASITMGVLSIAQVLFAALCLASFIATVFRPRTTVTVANAAARLQGIKDWFIRGDIEEADYQNLRKMIESADDERSAAIVARRSSILLRAFAFLLVPAAFFWIIFISIFTDELDSSLGDLVPYVINYVLGAILLVGLFVFGLVRGSQLRRFAAQQVRELAQRIDHAEEQVMRAARGRAGSSRSSSGGSFRPYAGR